MPSFPKAPLSVRLKALKEALLWVMGNEGARAAKVRRLTLLAPGLEGIHQSVSGLKQDEPIPLTEWALPLVDEATFKAWNALPTPGFKNPIEAELRALDVRFLFLIQTNKDFIGSDSKMVESLTKTALRMAWKNQTQDRTLLSMAHYLSSHHRLPNLEKTQLDMALSLEDIVPAFSFEQFEKAWKHLSTSQKTYLLAWGAALNVPLSSYPSVSTEMPLVSLDDGVSKSGLTWLAWASLFNASESVEKALQGGARVEQSTSFSPWLEEALEKELSYWKELALQTEQHQREHAQPDEASPSKDLRALFAEHAPLSMHPLTDQEATFKVKEVSALHWALMMDAKQSTELLLKHGANPNMPLNHRTANGLALSMMRKEWDLVLKLLKSGHKVKWDAGSFEKEDNTSSWLYVESPILCLDRNNPTSELAQKAHAEVCATFNQESPVANEEWKFAYREIIRKGYVQNFGRLLQDRPRNGNYFAPGGWQSHESGDLWLLFEGEKGPNIPCLKELAKHDVRIDAHAWRESDQNYNTWIIWPLLAWAPEALEEWLKWPKNHTQLPTLFKKRALGWDRIPSAWRSRVVCSNQWEKGDTHWTVAARSTQPKLALSLLKTYQAPLDCIHEKDHGKVPRDVWEIALQRKSDERLVEWVCQELGAPVWESDYPVHEYVTWTTTPRNEVEIENVLQMDILPLNHPINQQGDTLLHHAIEKKDEWLVEKWIIAGGDLDKPNFEGLTPRQLAKQHNWGQELLASAEQARLQKTLPDSSDAVPLKKKHL